MDELIETEAMQKKEVTLREYLDGLGEVFDNSQHPKQRSKIKDSCQSVASSATLL